MADVKVIAPVPVFEYSSKSVPAAPARRQDGAVEVFHPRWVYPPFGGAANALALFACTAGSIARVRRHYAFDILDAHFAHPCGIAAALAATVVGVPFSITLRGNETMHAEHAGRRKLMQWAFRNAAGMMAVSDRLREFAIDLGADPAKVRTVPNGINASIFFPRDRETVARAHGMYGVPSILSAGYLIEGKGHHRIIAALAKIRAQGVPAHLWIAGNAGRADAFEGRLHELVRKLELEDCVHFTGALKPEVLAEYMAAADVLCLASAREGWPNVVNEALACGTPVVATDVGAVAQMLPSEHFGYVVPQNDDAALAAALHQALSRSWGRDEIAAWGQSRSWEQVASETLDHLQVSLDRRRAAES